MKHVPTVYRLTHQLMWYEETMAIGLFADWRDITLRLDFELGTVLGTVLQVAHKIQHRQWSVFNALRKPERTVVNVQPLDFERVAGFVCCQLWGDLGKPFNCRARNSKTMRGSLNVSRS